MENFSSVRSALDATERYKALLELNNALIVNLSHEALLSSISTALSKVVRFDRAALVIYDPDSDSRRIAAIEGRSRSNVYPLGTELSRHLNSYAWRAFDEQRPILRTNLELDECSDLEA
jgi:transcriptional regulator with GAF, ATPase, and Fis domain